MKSMVCAFALLAAAAMTGCANCEACKQIPGWDGRYATHDHGNDNRPARALDYPDAPYVPHMSE